MESEPTYTSLLDAVKEAWAFSGSSPRFGRSFIFGELALALGAIGYSIMPRVADVPSYYISLSGVFLMYIALGELQFELWIKQRSIENRDVIIIGYRAISRFAMAIIFSASIAIIG